MTVESISSYKLVNAKHDNESDPTYIIESTVVVFIFCYAIKSVLSFTNGGILSG